MASMPLVPQTEPSAVLHDNGPKLFITGDRVTTGSSAPPAKQSLNFDNATTLAEQVVVYDTVVQTATDNQNAEETGAMAGGATGTSLQTCRVGKHPNVVKRREE